MTVLATPEGDRVVGSKSWPLAGLMGRQERAVGGVLDMAGIPGIGRTALYSRIFLEQLWVHVCVTKLARATARLPLKTYAVDRTHRTRAELELGTAHDLIARPYPRGSTFKLVESIVGSCCLYGNALCVKFREQGRGSPPVELWPVPWHRITIIEGEDRPIDGYIFSGTKGRVVLLPEDVVHFSWWNPDGHVGVSPLEPLARTIVAEDAAQRYAASTFANAARPASVIQPRENAGRRRMNRSQRAELRSELNAAYGGPDNAFKVAILDAGLEWKPIAWNAEEAALIPYRKLSREETCAVYDIPPPMVQILDRATFSNIDEQHRMLYQDTLAPWFAMMEETFRTQLLEPEPTFAATEYGFDLIDVLKQDHATRARAYMQFLQSGTYTPNELRAMENNPPIGDPEDPANPANMIYVPVNMKGVNGDADAAADPANIDQAFRTMLESVTQPQAAAAEKSLQATLAAFERVYEGLQVVASKSAPERVVARPGEKRIELERGEDGRVVAATVVEE